MVRQQRRVVAAGSYNSIAFDPSVIKAVKGKGGNIIDRRFIYISLLSILFHGVFIYYIRSREVEPEEVQVIEEIPERFARLIIEKPIPKKQPINIKSETQDESESKKIKTTEEKQTGSERTSAKNRSKTQRAVDRRVARVEKKLRTVGVLGMLTGVGATAKGPSVVDVLGSLNEKKERNVDLEAALDKMTGLQKTKNIDVLDRKLVKSKDIAISHKENIDDLIASVGTAKTVDLAKKGSFIIQKPESIEGAASSNAKRDNEAINTVVSSHKTSIRMSYEKYLKRDPTLAGKITVRFTIGSSGKVTMVQIVENTTGNSKLEKEIIRKIKMWRFEAIAKGDVSVTYPFVFAPAG